MEDETVQDVVARLEALEREVETLHDTVATATDGDIPLLKAMVRAITAADIDTIDDLPDAGSAFRHHVVQLANTVEELDQRVAALGDIGTEKTTKEQKYAQFSHLPRTRAVPRSRRSR